MYCLICFWHFYVPRAPPVLFYLQTHTPGLYTDHGRNNTAVFFCYPLPKNSLFSKGFKLMNSWSSALPLGRLKKLACYSFCFIKNNKNIIENLTNLCSFIWVFFKFIICNFFWVGKHWFNFNRRLAICSTVILKRKLSKNCY